MKWLTNSLYVFALSMAVLGLSAMSKSPISAIAGCGVAVIVAVGATIGMKKPTLGYSIAAVGTLLPIGQFLPKLIKDPAAHMYPQGIGVGLCAIALGLMAYGHFTKSPKAAA